MPARRILILGGTKEANLIAGRLVERPGFDVTTSLAGRTREPKPPAGRLRSGGFGGSEGLAEVLRRERFDLVVDATHPFAERISANAAAACAATGLPLLVLARPRWAPETGDDWLIVPSLETAASAIPAGARVLLALGSQHLNPFSSRGDVRFIVRMVDPPEMPPALPDHQIVLGRPSAAADEEAGLLQRFAVTHIVCRNSGGAGAYAKIEAARRLRLPVIMIDRPVPKADVGLRFSSVEALLAAIA
jgi:precorrin-6A/cobalt-precorrin-6A reductase